MQVHEYSYDGILKVKEFVSVRMRLRYEKGRISTKE